MKTQKPGFELTDLPNAFIGLFGIRTEDEVPTTIVMTDGDFQIREMAAHTELSIKQKGKRKAAANESFEHLFAFIKGHNKAQKQYSMTAPVWQEQAGEEWETSFYIPDAQVKVPAPKDPRLHLETKGKARFAIYRFNGMASDESVKEAIVKLKLWMKKEGLMADGAPRIAQFDPPFAVPFLRRNEIHIPLKK